MKMLAHEDRHYEGLVHYKDPDTGMLTIPLCDFHHASVHRVDPRATTALVNCIWCLYELYVLSKET